MSKEDDEYKKLYSLLSSLSSKTTPQTVRSITPVISLMTEKQTSRTLILDIPPLDTPIVEKPVEKPVESVVEKPALSPLEEIMSKSSKRSGITFTCDACMRTFPSSSQLLTHHKITPMCANWFSLLNKEEYKYVPTSIHIFMDDILAETVAAEDSPNKCRFCHSTFSNKGNLHKHFHTSIVCNRMAHARFKKVVANLK